MHEENSSSASADSTVTFLDLEWASAEILKISLAEGPSFFVREEYLNGLDMFSIQGGTVLPEEDTERLLCAARRYLVERDALGYLSRAEQCRFRLSIKLRRKGHKIADIDAALDWLERRGWLSDERFAESWLRYRSIHRPEGKFRLLAELRSRGIAADIAEEAILVTFSETAEHERCTKAVDKFRSRGREGQKLINSLRRAGFSHMMITQCLNKTGIGD